MFLKQQVMPFLACGGVLALMLLGSADVNAGTTTTVTGRLFNTTGTPMNAAGTITIKDVAGKTVPLLTGGTWSAGVGGNPPTFTLTYNNTNLPAGNIPIRIIFQRNSAS